MANAATVIVLTAGGMTFTNQWYQTRNLDWKVPVATVILAAGVDVFSKLDEKGAVILAALIFVGAATTKFNGRSPVNLVSQLIASRGTAPPKGSVSKIPNR